MQAEPQQMPLRSTPAALVRWAFRRENQRLDLFPKGSPIENKIFYRLEVVLSPVSV